MYQKLIFLFISALTIFLLSSCDKDVLNEPIATKSQVMKKSLEFNERQIIVLSAPSVHNPYYREVFSDIIQFQSEYANAIKGRDEVLILCDRDTRRYFDGKVDDQILVEAQIEDIWIRDFAPVVANSQIKFNYLPDYQNRRISNLIDNSFENWIHFSGLSFGGNSDLILDGGNVVDNGSGRVIVTDRILYDNPKLTMRSAKKMLKNILNAHEVAIIRETPGDATGHADGMLMWADENTILLHDQPSRVKSKIIRELERSFPGVHIVIVPDYYEDGSWKGFTSACNIFVNSLVTNDYIYVPTFNSRHDSEMISLIQSHTSKEVVPIPSEKVCFMGGSVRCLSWQVDGNFADALLSE
jgi:agmatine/peptidylarginine deiminase